ncbi:MAG: hypothetical protein NVSMB19_12410 [Vulcanimicrobiaceae bacterium]
MIDPALAAGLTRIAERERDALHAFDPGFVPGRDDVARTPQVVPNADPLGVAVPSGAYVVTPDATGRLTFTRDGAFAFVAGELRASDGRPVLGFAVGDRTKLAPLRADAYDVALGRVAHARVEADGTFGYERTSVDPRTGERRVERVAVGRVALGRFPAGSQPERLDGSHVAPPPGARPQIGVPGEGGFAPLATFARDLGRVDILAGLEKLGEAYVAFEALRAANRSRGTVEKTAMDLVK